jgi:hypothetical protein
MPKIGHSAFVPPAGSATPLSRKKPHPATMSALREDVREEVRRIPKRLPQMAEGVLHEIRPDARASVERRQE